MYSESKMAGDWLLSFVQHCDWLTPQGLLNFEPIKKVFSKKKTFH